MISDNHAALERLFLTLCDRTRLRLLGLMAAGEVPVGYLAEQLGESQPKVSRHLAYLRSMGVVSTRRDGKRVYYGVQVPEDAAAARLFSMVISELRGDRPARLVDAAPSRWTVDDNISPQPYMTQHDDDLPVYLL